MAHSGVTRNGNGVCPRIPKSGYNVLFPNLALSMELPGMAMYIIYTLPFHCKNIIATFGNWKEPDLETYYVSKSGSFQFPKVAIMFCFQIWLFPWSCQEWPKLAMYMFPWSCQEWQWCVQDLETDTLPLLAITEHTPLLFLATPEWPDLETVTLPLLAITDTFAIPGNSKIWKQILPLLAITEHTCHYKMSRIWTHLYIASFGTS